MEDYTAEMIRDMAFSFCPQCGTAIVPNHKGRPRKFCSPECRSRWNNTHPKPENWKTVRLKICPVCGGEFSYGGLDLSSTGDITAFVLMFPPRVPEEKYIMLPFFWIPEDTIPQRVRRASVPYDVWYQQGYLMATEGNVIHYDKIPSERMNADKCIGFCIEENGGFAGMYELVVNDKVQRENINSINYFRDDKLVQQAISDMEKLMAARQQSKEQERGSTKKSVLDALRSLKAKKQDQPAQEQDKPKKAKKKGMEL